MLTSRPDHIAFFASFADFQQKQMTSMPIVAAEAFIARTRNIPEFHWIEFHPDQLAFLAARFTIINPNKLGICHMGAGIGLTTVTVAPIACGEKLVFAGISTQELTEEDYSNPYLITMLNDNAAVHTNAKVQGGFASMLMDVPSTEVAQKFQQITQQSLLTNCFDISIYHSSRGTPIMILGANRDIAAYSLIGLDYNPSSRLRYTAFKAFYADGLSLTTEHDQLIQRLTSKELYYRDFSRSACLLIRFTNTIKKQSKKRLAQFYAENNPGNHHLPELLESLTYQELEQLKCLVITCIDCISSTEIVECLKLISNELHLRYLQPRNSTYISCLRLMLQSNRAQAAQRGSDAREYISANGELYKDYPDIAKHHFQLASLIESKLPAMAREHYKISLFYARHHHENLLSAESTAALKRLDTPASSSYCNIL